MNAHTEKAFEEIAREAVGKAANVDCSTEDYRQGLRLIIEELEMDRQASLEMDGEDD